MTKKETCRRCNGTGIIEKSTTIDLHCTCDICRGHKVVDWINNITGKTMYQKLNEESFIFSCNKSIHKLINLLGEYAIALGYHLKIELVPYERNERGIISYRKPE